jgi:acyl-[acyl-carrier-protein]-phospholipid O-acyltransferase / long-chain-fatty-acid--[acyl-carrier-protein] ligase
MPDDAPRMPRSFLWLNAAQFGGALNDNLFKLLAIFLLIEIKGAEAAGLVTAVIGAIFVVPFLLFSPLAGVLADRFSKQRITVAIKVAEILAMSLAVWAFALRSELLTYAVMFLMAAQSAFFSPTKYGIVPELVARDALSRANGLYVLFTYLAIILGTALAPSVDLLLGGRPVWPAACCLLIAAAGLVAARRIEPTPAMGRAGRVSLWVFGDTRRALRGLRGHRTLHMSVWLAAYFLFLGGFAQLNLIPYGMHMLGLSQQASAYLFLLAALGIGAGAWSVGRLSGRRVELRWTAVGMAGAGLCCAGLALTQGHLPATGVVIGVLGISVGFFVVPLDAYIQQESPDAQRGEIAAAKSVLSWLGVLLAAALMYLFDQVLHLDPAQGFLVVGGLTLLLLLVLGWRFPILRRRDAA